MNSTLASDPVMAASSVRLVGADELESWGMRRTKASTSSSVTSVAS